MDKEEQYKGGLNEGSQVDLNPAFPAESYPVHQGRVVAGFAIEKNIPVVPAKRKRSRIGEALFALRVGESFFIPDKEAFQVSGHFKRHEPKKFCSRTERGGCRVWRIK